MAKKSPEKFKTYGNVFDEFTKRNLFNLSSQGYFEELISPIALGKEANVFSAIRKDDKKVIVKIYRLENCDFTKMYQYIKADDRYQNISKNRRNVIFAWTQREYRNLHKARDAGILVPTPLHFVYNILIEEFIGDEDVAPQLKNSEITDLEDMFQKVIASMKKLHKAGLVHGDLSAFNILNWNDEPYFIDFSQTTELKSAISNEMVQRDIRNITNYFKKLGLKITEESVTKMVTS